MKDKIREIDDMMAHGEDILIFPIITEDVRTMVRGPLRLVSTRTAMWTQGRHFRYDC